MVAHLPRARSGGRSADGAGRDARNCRGRCRLLAGLVHAARRFYAAPWSGWRSTDPALQRRTCDKCLPLGIAIRQRAPVRVPSLPAQWLHPRNTRRRWSQRRSRHHQAPLRWSAVRRPPRESRSPTVWHPAGILGPAPSLFRPLQAQALVGSCRSAQVSGGQGPRLVEVALVESERQTGHLGQQRGPVAPAGKDPVQLGHRGSRLRLGRLLPSRVPPGCPGQAGHDQAGRIEPGTILTRLARIEHGNDKSKLARLVPPAAPPGKMGRCRP